MSYVDKDVLKSFMSDDNFLTKEPAEPGFQEAIDQADNIIYQYTHIETPATPDAGIPMLRNIACALILWFTAGIGSDLSEQEYERRKKLYNDAVEKLEKIQTGEINLIDAAGESVEQLKRPAVAFSSTRRLTELP